MVHHVHYVWHQSDDCHWHVAEGDGAAVFYRAPQRCLIH
jgi:hypothetical protein